MPPTPPAMNWSMFEPIWSLYYVCQKPNSHHNLFSSLGGVGENGHVIGEWSHLHFTSQIFCQICYPTWTWWLKTVFCKRYKLGGLAAVCYATPCTFFIFGHSNFNWYFPQNMSPKTRWKFQLGTRWKTWPDKRKVDYYCLAKSFNIKLALHVFYGHSKNTRRSLSNITLMAQIMVQHSSESNLSLNRCS